VSVRRRDLLTSALFTLAITSSTSTAASEKHHQFSSVTLLYGSNNVISYFNQRTDHTQYRHISSLLCVSSGSTNCLCPRTDISPVVQRIVCVHGRISHRWYDELSVSTDRLSVSTDGYLTGGTTNCLCPRTDISPVVRRIVCVHGRISHRWYDELSVSTDGYLTGGTTNCPCPRTDISPVVRRIVCVHSLTHCCA